MLHIAIYNSSRPYTWHLLFPSWPIFVIATIGVVSCWNEHSKRFHISEDDPQRGLRRLVQISFRKGFFQLSQGAYAPFELVFDGLTLLSYIALSS